MKKKDEEHDRVGGEQEHRREDDRERDDDPRELRLADEPLARHDGHGRAAGAAGEDRPVEHDVHQEHRWVVRLGAAKAPDAREDGVHDAEDQERLDHRPCHAEGGSLVSGPELGLRDQPQELEETLRLAAECGRAADLPERDARRLGDRCHEPRCSSWGAEPALPRSSICTLLSSDSRPWPR